MHFLLYKRVFNYIEWLSHPHKGAQSNAFTGSRLRTGGSICLPYSQDLKRCLKWVNYMDTCIFRDRMCFLYANFILWVSRGQNRI